jgi:hypothetical protein
MFVGKLTSRNSIVFRRLWRGVKQHPGSTPIRRVENLYAVAWRGSDF